MAALTQTEIDELVATLKKHPYLCSAGADSLGPLEGPPTVAPEVETKDVVLYETLGNAEASYLIKNDLKVTLRTRNVDKAMELIGAIKKGDNMIESSRKTTLTMVPITESASEKTITFTDAYLQPGLGLAPGDAGEATSVELVYICKANAATGVPFTYA